MAPNPFERIFKKNLDNDEVFERTAGKEISKIIDDIGANMPGLHLAYKKAQELNAERKSPQHKHYLLNLIQSAALNSSRFIIDSALNPDLERDVRNEIVRMREED
jgi:hypothetical protein